MDDKKADVKSGSILSQKVSRRSVLKAGLVGAAGLTAGPIFEACSIIPSSSNNRPNKIVIEPPGEPPPDELLPLPPQAASRGATPSAAPVPTAPRITSLRVNERDQPPVL